MPKQVGVIRASLKYQGKDGKAKSAPRMVGRMMEHSDGSRYIVCDGFFDWGKYAKNAGNAFFLSIVTEQPRAPGQEG